MAKLPVGIQVYNLRDLLENTPERFEEVMTKVKELGYDFVELAGLYGIEPAKIREILDKVGIPALSAHVPLVEMVEDAEKVAKDYSLIGCKYVVVPYLPEEFRPIVGDFEFVLGQIPKFGEVMKKYGMELLYHNHDFEFVKLENGKYAFDEMYDSIPADLLKAELDTCWAQVAVDDAAGYVKKYTDRLPIVHLKDYIKKGDPKSMYKLIGIDDEEGAEEDTGYFGFRPVGFGQQIWEPILNEALAANSRYVVVEQDEHYELDPLECARRSREYLRILGW